MPESPRERREKLLTTAQAAEYFGVDRRTLARYARTGLVKPTVVLPSGHLRWSLEDIERQLAEFRARQNHEDPPED
ncbi:helix-turn-helix domain-containing protein [Pseudonocardia lacus]|uniref:helix-turn-helix domain-containing protein n=1 Tax=Pseudonocardia lacus TaxID=2835865 RepID=UPI001BDD8B5B|nr:helix-turn-helix domain-containing protein [Pseudonocardia lacus]